MKSIKCGTAIGVAIGMKTINQKGGVLEVRWGAVEDVLKQVASIVIDEILGRLSETSSQRLEDNGWTFRLKQNFKANARPMLCTVKQ